MKPQLILALATAFISQPTATQAADIYVAGMRWTGIPAIWIDGQIDPGDERKFAAVVRRHQASVVYLTSPGGDIGAAIEIGRMVGAGKLDTFVGRGGNGCWSACTLIFLSGRRCIIQRNSYLGFHAANVPEGTEAMLAYLRELGLTLAQINYMIRTPQPEIQLAMEWHARALGFHYQEVPSLFGGWQSCRAKYCLAVP
jgi:hypothetical protein